MKTSERGVVLLLVTLLMLLVVFPIVGLAVDGGVAFSMRARLQTAVDGAALAAARSLSRGRSLSEQTASAEQTARDFFQANMHMPGSNIAGVTMAISWPAAPPKTAVIQVDASANSPTYFLRLMGYNSLRLSATGTANRRDVNIVLVLDRSGSIENMGACDELRAAAKNFVGTFVDGRDRLALVTFGTTYKLDFPAAFDFKSASTPITTHIDNVRCVGGTTSAAAYWTAWKELERLNEANTLNVILFFTDGMPNGLHMKNLVIKGSSTCTDKSAREGVITPAGTSVWGILQFAEPTAPPARNPDWVAISNRSGCYFGSSSSTFNKVKDDVVSLAPTGASNEVDAFGNSLTGYKSVGRDGSSRIRIDEAATITNAATNALDSAASRVRTLSTSAGLDVYTYCIALGGAPAPPESTLLNRVANTADSPVYDAARPTGMFVTADNASQLEQAFSQLASDILRISR